MGYVVYIRCGILILLTITFISLFYYLRRSGIVSKKLQQAFETIDMNELARTREEKRTLEREQQGILSKLDKRLKYSGLKRRFPFITIEIWILAILICGALAYFLVTLITENWIQGLLAAFCVVAMFLVVQNIMARREYQITDEALMDFLNLLGNYSITTGEVTSIFGQISKYFKPTMSQVLDACYYEAQITGDSAAALHTLADSLEHPQFKEIIRNIEICSRYTTNFAALIRSCKKELKGYYSGKQERKAMANEAVTNMIIIIALMIIALLIVDNLIEMSIWTVVFQTMVGKICLISAGILIAVFIWEVSVIEK